MDSDFLQQVFCLFIFWSLKIFAKTEKQYGYTVTCEQYLNSKGKLKVSYCNTIKIKFK